VQGFAQNDSAADFFISLLKNCVDHQFVDPARRWAATDKEDLNTEITEFLQRSQSLCNAAGPQPNLSKVASGMWQVGSEKIFAAEQGPSS